jgi:hypothetical protein
MSATPSTNREAFRTAVADIAAKAKAKLPECNGRVEKAVKLVLAGDVAVLDHGRAVVASMTDPTATYSVEHSVCSCPDFPHAPHGFCAHRIAAGIARRVQELLPRSPDVESEAAAQLLPEAPVSCNVHLTIAGRQVQLTLRGTSEDDVLARLETVLQRYPLPQTPAAPRQEPHEGLCPVHHVPMRWNDGEDGRKGWYSHRLPEGQWCKGKAR